MCRLLGKKWENGTLMVIKAVYGLNFLSKARDNKNVRIDVQNVRLFYFQHLFAVNDSEKLVKI